MGKYEVNTTRIPFNSINSPIALSLMAFATVLVYTHGSLTAQKTGMMARVMCTAAIYDKVYMHDELFLQHPLLSLTFYYRSLKWQLT